MKGHYSGGCYYGYVPSERRYWKFPTQQEYEDWYIERYGRNYKEENNNDD